MTGYHLFDRVLDKLIFERTIFAKLYVMSGNPSDIHGGQCWTCQMYSLFADLFFFACFCEVCTDGVVFTVDVMEDNPPPSTVSDGVVVGIKFGMATRQEICTASISDSSISHASQLSNPFLGLPLEFGRCESCGTSEAGKCEGHFGYIELPVPIYHPSHVSELKRMLSLICLNCLKMRRTKFPASSSGLAQRLLSPCCEEVNAALVSIREVKTSDGACYLALKVSKSKMQNGFWSFLEKYGYRYEDDHTRALLPCEVVEIIKRIPIETKKKLAGKGYFPQDGYVLKYLPVPPNCLSVPVVSDGVTVMSSDPAMTILRKLLRKVEIIRSSRSGEPNFESHHVEANDLQSVVDQYLQVRGTSKVARDIETHFGVNKELNESSTKAWLEKMRTLFIRKGSGFSSRNVITGDGYKRINEVGIPAEVAQRITFEERVNIHNISYLQKLVDENLCLTYKEGVSTYSLREGSKGHIYLKPGQIVHRRIMDGDIVFINRPPTTHKHSLQALVVYIHDDHTVKINPLICGPLGADFDGDCVHLFYPQSLAAKAEVVELFSVENQLLSSHSGNLNLQLSTDSLLSLKMLVKRCFFDRAAANQLAMFLSLPLPRPALLKSGSGDSHWTSVQMLQCALPLSFDCTGGRYLIRQSEILEFDLSRDVLPATINEIAASIFFGKGPKEALNFFDVLQPFLMESIFADGFSVGLQDFSISRAFKRVIDRGIGKLSSLLYQLRSIYNELVAQQLEKHIRDVEIPVIDFALKSTKLGDLIDSKSKSAIEKVVQQVGFLGQQIFDRGRFYSKGLVEDVASHFHLKCCYDGDVYPSAEYGLLKGCFIHGLDPYEELVHSISTREIIVRSSRGLSEPGTLFKNLMAILRDVVICYDGTVRNVCSNSIIQFEYGAQAGEKTQPLFPAGEPVGVLAATSMSNPAYKAVLDASPSSNSSWEFMKEILLCKVNFRNEPIDRRVILYFNDCDCGRSYCRENAAYLVKNQLRKISLKDTALEFIIEYQSQLAHKGTDAGFVGHIHLDKIMLKERKINMADVSRKCQDRLNSFRRKKKIYQILKRTELSFSESCSFLHPSAPCVSFFWIDGSVNDADKTANIMADLICPVLLETIIQGDPRISSASIIWASPDANTWVRNPYKSSHGELALDVILEKEAVKQSGDAWRIVLDSCLPVLDLIDTRRSIPYAIKQIQELLGISCTFDQAIQRLAASVKMVAKGVLREHLILLASSMTCGGNLVGFNTGGYKALARQLNIQVPFTDATLFTPKKCFERAAEKCHTDSLSSVVASCSWGKHVAVGTGSKFDLLWDENEIKSNEIEGMDVYNFLHMVKGLTGGEEENNACLGEDIDDLLEENMDWSMSPEHTSGFNAVFEENFELPNDSTSNGWDANTNQTGTKDNEWSGWVTNKAESKDSRSGGAEEDPWKKSDVIQEAKSNEWSTWDRNKYEIPAGGSEKVKEDSWSSQKHKADVEQEDSLSFGAWNANPANQLKEKSNEWSAWGDRKKSETPSTEMKETGSERAQEDSWSSRKWKADDTHKESSMFDAWNANNNDDQTQTKSNDWSTRGRNKFEKQDGGSKRAQGDSWSSCKWNVATTDDSSRFGAMDSMTRDQTKTESKRVQEGSQGSQKWKAGTQEAGVTQNDLSRSRAWDVKDQEKPNSNDRSSWTRNKVETKHGESERAVDDSWGKWKPESKVGADVMQEDSLKSNAWECNSDNSSWGKSRSPKNKAASSKGWDLKFDLANSDGNKGSQWGKRDNSDNSSWGKLKSPENQAASSQGWDSKFDSASDGNKGSQWGKKDNSDNSSWGKAKSPENQAASSQGWDSKFDSANSDGNKGSQWGKKDNSDNSSWGKPKSSESQAWDSDIKSNQFAGSQGWDSKFASVNSDGNKGVQWGKKDNSDNSSWGKPKSSENQAWSSNNKSNQAPSSQGWDSQLASANSEGDKGFQWGKKGREPFKKNRFEGSQAWGSNSGDRRNQNRPPRAPGPIYSSEEQDVLKDIEPIMQSIRRIMQQQGYNDGDPLASEDQCFVLENVFEHHPDKENKMGAGIDYVMVSRHSSFQDSRCFYVVLKDGSREDFSYLKCLDNFIRKKYPEVAESFIGKFFRKRGKRDQTANQAADQTGTPGLDETATPATPAANQTATPGQDETATPGPMETNE
ncbi:hypothetical protein RJT34_01506 [Clitoria ternatea]|uniref:DNA-directed RNA polymerase subunit n=1 Tax=Clitoria ternatea TaxID=43366 RepID=A0AAN9KHS0_CLITE